MQSLIYKELSEFNHSLINSCFAKNFYNKALMVSEKCSITKLIPSIHMPLSHLTIRMRSQIKSQKH